MKEGRNKKGHMSASVIPLFDMVDVCVPYVVLVGHQMERTFPSKDSFFCIVLSSSTLFHGPLREDGLPPTPNPMVLSDGLFFFPITPQPLIIRAPLHRDKTHNYSAFFFFTDLYLYPRRLRG